MSLAVLADHLASKGRNGDTMLVHMTPGEVQGLHALALAHGGKLTINPDTGLPEASFLKRLLPMIAGMALNAFLPGVGTAIGAALGTSAAVGTGLLVGGVTGLATGSLRQGIMAGLGAYGGASLAGGLQAAGSATAGAPGVEAIVGDAAAQQQLAAANELSMATAGQPLSAAESQRLLYSTLSPTDKLTSGISALGSEQGRAGFMEGIGGKTGLYKAGAAALAPAAFEQPSTATTRPRTPYTFRVRPASVGYEGDIEQLPMSSALTPTGMNSGGIVALARGGGFRSLEADGDAPIFEDYGVDQSAFAPLYSPAPTPAPAPAAMATPILAPEPPRPTFTDRGFIVDPEPTRTNVISPAPAPISAPTVVAAPAPATGLGALVGATTPAATSVVTPSGVVVPTTKLDFATGAEVLPNYLGLNAVAAGAPRAVVSTEAGPGYDYAAAQLKDKTDAAVNAIYNRVLGRQAEQSGLDYWSNAVRSGTLSLADVEKRIQQIGEKIGISVDPTQLVTPSATQLAAQRSILADPQAAALREVQAGINTGKTAQEIADAINAKYGKSFSAENVRDFIANNKMKAEIKSLFPDTTPGVVTTGEPFKPTTTTMEQVRSDYVKGGGRTDMPTITNILPTDRTYTQNQAFAMLQGYLQSNPNALYGDVVAFARSKGIPDMQAKAAYNEFRFSGLTGGSKQAYDYLMGRGAYPASPFLPPGTSVYKPYYEAVRSANEPLAFTGRKTIPTAASRQTALSTGSADTTSGNQDEIVTWRQKSTGQTIKDKRGSSLYSKDPDWEIVSTNAARGGLMDVAAAAAARGGNVQQYNLGGYSDGGRLLRGPGDGVSDSIPATIGNKQPARLADGEFVIPARIVSEIGNGSTEAGARKLYAMMDRVQRARAKTTGKGRVAKDTKADKYLPA